MYIHIHTYIYIYIYILGLLGALDLLGALEEDEDAGGPLDGPEDVERVVVLIYVYIYIYIYREREGDTYIYIYIYSGSCCTCISCFTRALSIAV